MYAIIKTGGKQVKVEVGQTIFVEKLNAEAGETVTFDQVVLVGGESTKVGTPLVEGASVVAKVEKQDFEETENFLNLLFGKEQAVLFLKHLEDEDGLVDSEVLFSDIKSISSENNVLKKS